MIGKAVASSVGLLLGIAFLLPFWAAAEYENDDSIMILFGVGLFFSGAVVAFLLALAWTVMAYAMRPFHRGSPWTVIATLGVGGVSAALIHAFLALQARSASRASGQPNLYEDSYTGFWLAVVTAVVTGIALVIAAPRAPRRPWTTDQATGPSRESPPSPPQR